MAQKLSTLALGALVKDPATVYNGQPIIWRIVDKNHAGYPSGAITLMTDKIISIKSFDAIEPSNSDSYRRTLGNNNYIYSNIRSWLNSTAEAGTWYSAQHSADGPPNNANVWSNYNEYDAEAGFQYSFSTDMRNALLSTTLTVGLANVDGGGTANCSDKIFLASCTEIGSAGDQVCGVKLAAFSSDASRQARPTTECVSKSEYKNGDLNASALWYYWLRDACASDPYNVRVVKSSGALYQYNAYGGSWGIRPLCNLWSEICVSDAADSDGAYTIIWNQPPTKPATLTVPTTVMGGKASLLSCTASTDPDGNLAGYIFERSTNGTSWTEIYKGINRTTSDIIPFGTGYVYWRVCAYDTDGEKSEYNTSAKLTVINNTPPTITGTDGSLGAKTGAFTINYTVGDVDATNTLNTTEKLDGKVLRTFTPVCGTQNALTVTADTWQTITNGTHTLTISASDGYETTIRTYTFTKTVNQIEFALKTPLAANNCAERGFLSIARQIPAGAVMTVEVCNNGFDTAPTWEDVTNRVLSGIKFYLSNRVKTAAKWGYNVRIKVNRNGAVGDCYIQSIGGNFD